MSRESVSTPASIKFPDPKNQSRQGPVLQGETAAYRQHQPILSSHPCGTTPSSSSYHETPKSTWFVPHIYIILAVARSDPWNWQRPNVCKYCENVRIGNYPRRQTHILETLGKVEAHPPSRKGICKSRIHFWYRDSQVPDTPLSLSSIIQIFFCRR